jgi:hypothetical protein
MLAFPELGRIRVVSMDMVVVLPAPLWPKKPNISPSLIDKFNLSTAVKPSYLLLKLFVTSTLSPSYILIWFHLH